MGDTDAAVTEQQQKQDDQEALASRLQQVNAICAHMGLNVFSLTVVMTQRIMLLRQATGLNPADAAALLASISSGVGAVEFALNPIAGKASDAYGRRPFLLQSPAMSALLKSLVFLYPSSTTIGLEVDTHTHMGLGMAMIRNMRKRVTHMLDGPSVLWAVPARRSVAPPTATQQSAISSQIPR